MWVLSFTFLFIYLFYSFFFTFDIYIYIYIYNTVGLSICMDIFLRSVCGEGVGS